MLHKHTLTSTHTHTLPHAHSHTHTMNDLPDPFTIAEHTLSILPHIPFVQEIDEQRLNDFLASGYEGKYDEEWVERSKHNFASVRDHAAAIADRLKDGKLNTRLGKPSGAKLDNARVYHQGMVTVSELSGDVRDYLLAGKYVDYDIKNCQPTLLLQEANRADVALPGVEQYVNHREAVFEELCEATKCTKAQAKTFVIRLLFGGSPEGWVATAEREHAADERTPVPDLKGLKRLSWVSAFLTDIQTILGELKRRNADLWKTTANTVRTQNRRRNEKKRPEARFLAIYAQGLERRVLDEVFKRAGEERRRYMIYTYDGFMIPTRFEMSVDILSTYTNTKFPLVSWAVKPMEKHLEIVAPYVEANKNRAPDELEVPRPTPDQCDRLDVKYMNSLPTYKAQLQYFNSFVIKVRNGDFWVSQRLYDQYANGGRGAYTRKQWTMDWGRLMHAYGSVRTAKVWCDKKRMHVPPSKGQAQFLTRYRFDDDQRAVDDITFHPEPVTFEEIKQMSSAYNTFLGYPTHLFDPDVEIEPRHGKALNAWYDILRELCAGDGSCGRLDDAAAADNYVGMINFFACCVMEPAKRLEVAPLIYGNQGNGKGTILESIGNVVGREHYLSTSNINDILGDHAEGLLNKILVNLDECDAADQKGRQGQMKTLVTMKQARVNPKHLRPYDIDVFNKLVLTSNKLKGVDIDLSTGDRRWGILNATNKYIKHPSKFWQQLHDIMETQGFQKLLFEALRQQYEVGREDVPRARDFDFRAWKERNSRRGPYRAIAVDYTPPLAFYLQDLIETQRFVHVGSLHRDDSTDYEQCMSAFSSEEEFDINARRATFWDDERYEQNMVYSDDAMLRDFEQWSRANRYSFTEKVSRKWFTSMITKFNLPMRPVTHQSNRFHVFKPRELYTTMCEKKFVYADEKSPAVAVAAEEGVDEFGLLA